MLTSANYLVVRQFVYFYSKYIFVEDAQIYNSIKVGNVLSEAKLKWRVMADAAGVMCSTVVVRESSFPLLGMGRSLCFTACMHQQLVMIP